MKTGMKANRELVFGLLAALISFAIITGSLTISFIETEMGLPLAQQKNDADEYSSTPTYGYTMEGLGEQTLMPLNIISSMKTMTIQPSPTTICPIPDTWIIITVQPGDSIDNLAQYYQTSPETLMQGNCLVIPSIMPGSRLYVPVPTASPAPTLSLTPSYTTINCSAPPAGWVMYTVQEKDTLYSLATAYGVTVQELQSANCLGTSTLIYVGQTLWVPNVSTITPAPSNTPLPSNTPIPSNTPTCTNTATQTSTAIHRPILTRRPTRTPHPTRTPKPNTDSLLLESIKIPGTLTCNCSLQ